MPRGRRGGSSVRARAGVLCVLALVVSCGRESLTLTIDFPSERAFVLTETAEVQIVAAESCNEALTHARSDPERSLRRSAGNACELSAGDVVIDRVPKGTVAFVVFAYNTEASLTEPILRGCRMLRVGDSPPASLAIALDFTGDYFPFEAAVLARGGPACPTADALCGGTCTP